MKAFKMDRYIICADWLDEAKNFFLHEIGGPLLGEIEEMDWDCEVCCETGETSTIRNIINRVLDERNAWLRMGVPCDLNWPFIVVKLPE
jgi:hypothetical protein